jgi:hypothetical protein
MKKIILPLLLVLLFTASAGWSAPQELTLKQIRSMKSQIVNLQKDINRLSRKLKTTKDKRLRAVIIDKIGWEQAKIYTLKNILYPRAPKEPAQPKPQTLAKQLPVAATVPSLEAGPEESLTREAVKIKRLGISYDAGLHGGVFAGTGGFFAGARVPLGFVLGPAVTALRLSAGLTQTMSSDRRYLPVSLDLVFNFPPGVFSGVENYLGGGLNYTVLATGRKQGTVGGQLFYGVQSDGFGGIVFGELGFAILRSGSFPSNSGLIVMAGFRAPFSF